MGGKRYRDRQTGEPRPAEYPLQCRMMDAYNRLQRHLGWRDAAYCPRDGKERLFIEVGSTGIHRGYRDQAGMFWIVDTETWPSRPVLFKELEEHP